MKKFISPLLLLLFLSLNLSSQTSLYFPFGISQKAILDSLTRHPHVKYDLRSDSQIWAQWGKRWMQYELANNELYLIRSGVYLNNPDSAAEIMQCVESYLDQYFDWKDKTWFSDKYLRWIAYRKHQWAQCDYKKEKGYQSIELQLYSRNYTPSAIRENWIASQAPVFDPTDDWELTQQIEKSVVRTKD
ncbi:MAG: hypothetical protein SF052_01235 [Bacteroidia bacterium]|nr:hypothetical protein [Bacteroidia bacterium]